MNGAEIVKAHNSGRDARTFNRDPVIKHFNLHIGSLDAVITVGDRVNDDSLSISTPTFREEMTEEEMKRKSRQYRREYMKACREKHRPEI